MSGNRNHPKNSNWRRHRMMARKRVERRLAAYSAATVAAGGVEQADAQGEYFDLIPAALIQDDFFNGAIRPVFHFDVDGDGQSDMGLSHVGSYIGNLADTSAPGVGPVSGYFYQLGFSGPYADKSVVTTGGFYAAALASGELIDDARGFRRNS